jgi:D-alanyl-D-alanine dipeptidase
MFQLLNMKYFFFIVLPLLIACGEKPTKKQASRELESHVDESKHPKEKKETSAKLFLAMNLVDIQKINSDIQVDLKYTTKDNFLHRVLYDTIKKAYLQKDVAVRLGLVQDYLSTLKPGYKLLVYDATRPISVQWEMWNALDTIPTKQRGKFVSNPVNHSLHNYGAAVDLTIIDEKGNPLDMGAKFDEIGEIAYPEKEAFFLAKGLLTQNQIENRKLLRKVMQAQNFRNLPTEWWHFNACSRQVAKLNYLPIYQEN